MQPKQICILTGATGGIGKATAQLFDAEGYQLVLHGRNELKLEALKKSLQGNHHIICGDLNDAEARKILIDEAFANQAHQPTMLLNNAGISQFKGIDEVSSYDIESLIATNLIATIDFTRLFLNRVKQGSTIVNVGSAFGAIGYPGYSVYCASKFGLRGFTEALMRELATSQHRVCYFAPRATNTSINSECVQKMNSELGNHSDSPEFVAQELLNLINSKSSRKTVGWPEKFFARINGVLPEIVDKSIIKQSKEILTFARGEQ